MIQFSEGKRSESAQHLLRQMSVKMTDFYDLSCPVNEECEALIGQSWEWRFVSIPRQREISVRVEPTSHISEIPRPSCDCNMSWSIIELLFGNLCISSMENDEKKDKDQPNFNFLVPFSPNTPRIEKHSSVFFTPPYSNEGPSSLSRAPRCLNEKIPFDLSIGSEDFTDKFDIMRGLSDKGLVFTVCNLIFGCLDDLSLCR